MKIYILIGTRPNFIKVTQFKRLAAERNDLQIQIIHTGQHYDEKMADVFFRQFGLEPDHYLNIAPASPNKQIAEIMIKLEELCDQIGKPDVLLVPGDVNSTLAGALFANKNYIKLGHIEAGLRSFDRSMPEEFNRLLTDQLSDLFFVTEPSGLAHLKKEGVPEDAIHYVGNTMIDTMLAFEKEIEASAVLRDLKLEDQAFVLMTMHRPATVDNREGLQKLTDLIHKLSDKYKVVFPIHPRTTKNLKEFGLYEKIKDNRNLICTEPLDYFAFQKLIKNCAFIITDSGGIQEESTYRQKPCITLRPNTERPVTVDIGSNTLLPFDLAKIQAVISEIEAGTYKKGEIPEFWDGKATERILTAITKS
jgi:UDP-N-acetylglucosamine 2-epimerase (non-hydrolysing)